MSQDFRLFWTKEKKPVMHRGEIHMHRLVGPGPLDSDREPFFYDGKRPLELDCDKCGKD